MRSWMTLVFAIVLACFLYMPRQASAKFAKNPCAKADLKLAQTGVGDSDGDGVSDCRERMLHTLTTNPDTDHDGLPDGTELRIGSSPLDPDSDDDGIDDGDDNTPVVDQRIFGLLDALTCPQVGVAGSISALGTTAVVDMNTEFDDTTCDQLAALLVPGADVAVKIAILEDPLGALTATDVELRNRQGDDDGHDD
jgi:hypothetical protein